jgi:hypothetical protein
VTDHVHEALTAAIEVPTRRYLWVPEDAQTFVPRVCSHVFGDGRALLELSPMFHRPLFYVVRIDSAWADDSDDAPRGAVSLREHLDEIYGSIEEDFGRALYEDDNGEETVDPWPAADFDGGSCWKRRDWPADRGFALDPHPFARYRNILSAVRESSIVIPPPLVVSYRVSAVTLLSACPARTT